MWRFLALMTAILASTSAARAEMQVAHDIHYGPDEKQIVEIYRPDSCSKPGSCPVTLWVHGGGWKHGDTTRKHASSMLTAWAEKGIVMVGVNYRLSPAVQHPAHVQDVAAAINWAKQNIGQYGGDPENISLLGHSAGAHLVALVATNRSYLGKYQLEPATALKNVFPIDTASFDLTQSSRFVKRLVRNAFGENEDVLKEASPIYNVHEGMRYPSFIIAATQVRKDAVQTSQELQQKLRDAKAHADLIIVDYPHAGQLKAHGMIAKDLANMDADLTRRLIDRVLER